MYFLKYRILDLPESVLSLQWQTTSHMSSDAENELFNLLFNSVTHIFKVKDFKTVIELGASYCIMVSVYYPTISAVSREFSL